MTSNGTAPLSPETPLGRSTATTMARPGSRASTTRRAAPAKGRDSPAPNSASTTTSAPASSASTPSSVRASVVP